MNNCSTCGNVCAFPDAVAACLASVCQLSHCQTNYWDIDGDPTNDCEYYCVYQSANDTPDLGFADANCDGIDGDPNHAIFVDWNSGSDANGGSIGYPVATIAQAIQLASLANPLRDVYISKGTYNETVTLKNGVNLYGGYDAANNWSRANANTTAIVGTGAAGVIAQNLTSPVELQLLSITSHPASGTNPTGDGNTAVGILALNSSGGLTVRGCSVSAGDGAPGNAGTSGTAGGAGGSGTGAVTLTHGAGGASACSAAGGNGGDGIYDTNPGHPGVYGGPGVAGGAGGLGGAAGSCGNVAGIWGSSPGYSAPVPGTAGGAVAGNTGAAGAGGGPGVAFGSLDGSGNYLAQAGGDGNSGLAGMGGGGGGSGGGSSHGLHWYTTCGDCDDTLWGGAGGGGGAGGCGGTAGSGGRGGGGSVALVMVSTPVTIDTSTFTSGTGGSGGAGGNGGGGGSGGPGGGGAIGDTHGTNCGTQSAGNGAPGASGGVGGQGGGGGGGTGGPSVCIVYKGLNPSLMPGQSLNCVPGAPGQGGAAGSGGAPGPSAGARGLSTPLQPST